MAQKKTSTNLGNAKKKELIELDNEKVTIKHQCELLGLPRSTAYYRSHSVIEPSQEEVAIKNAIDKIHFNECAYGCRRIRVELAKQGFKDIGKRRLRRYMEEMAIVAFYPGPNLSKRDLKGRTYPYLLRNVPITHVNQAWGIDITYCGTPRGFMYLVSIIDWHSRLIVGWTMSNTMQTDFVIRAIEEAIKTHGAPEIMNSDQGSQFTSKAYIDCIKSKETIRISMDGKGRCRDNARIERFFRNYKWERLYPESPQTVLELKQMTKQYMKHYNWNRPHQALEYATPASIYYAENVAQGQVI